MTCTADWSTTTGAGVPKARVKFKGGQEDFDAVVMATHSDTALALRGSDATPLEATVLRAIPYNANDVYLHSGGLTRKRLPVIDCSSCSTHDSADVRGVRKHPHAHTFMPNRVWLITSMGWESTDAVQTPR